MNTSRYISQKISAARSNSFTASVTKIAIISIAIGLAVMIVSFAILEGFRNEIQTKIFSFGAHLSISKYDTDNSYEGLPITISADLDSLEQLRNVRHVQTFARKTAIIKTKEEVMGAVLKGVGPGYDLAAMQKNLVSGTTLKFNDSAAVEEIMMSKRMADKLRMKQGDTAIFFFVQNPPRIRKLRITGIFNTGLEEFDEVYVIGDIKMVRELNNWPDSLVGGYEIFLNDFAQIDRTAFQVNEQIAYDMQLEKITDQYAQLFDWLMLLKRNVVIFLVLIGFVAMFNMVSTIFIMIMERTSMIGLLKALGATDFQIRQVFFYIGLKLTLKGLLFGNMIGLGFCLLQDYFKFIPLDPENYYMETVPIHWNWGMFLLLNAVILVLTMLSIAIPSLLVTRIKPLRAIKFN